MATKKTSTKKTTEPPTELDEPAPAATPTLSDAPVVETPDPELETNADAELLARNEELGVQREAILEEQARITAELDRRARARHKARVDEAAANGQVSHVAGAPDESGVG